MKKVILFLFVGLLNCCSPNGNLDDDPPLARVYEKYLYQSDLANIIPEGFSIETFGKFIEQISMRYYPEIPTGVGFCMHIKRKVLNDIGYFDETSFSNGYGEENDFCWRASQQGYLHVLDDATFIFHRGGGSFTSQVKLVREETALNIMQRLHPKYNYTVQKFIHDNPLMRIHEYILLRLSLKNKKLLQTTIQGYT